MSDEIDRIMEEPEGRTALDKVELCAAVSGKVPIAGRDFPAPAPAVFAMLDVIDSPFVSGADIEPSDLDVFRALYVLSERENAVGPVMRWQRRREALERLKNDISDADAPHNALIVAEMAKQIADAEADFDVAAIRFADSLGKFSISEAAHDICFYLALSGGFSMLPDSSKKKPEP